MLFDVPNRGDAYYEPNSFNGPVQTPRAATVDGRPVVQIAEPFDRAWRRVGLALDRTGFTVEDRDRSAGTYFVRYVTPNPDKKEPGLFAKMLSFGKAAS